MSMFNDPLTKALADVAQNIMEKKVMCEACGKMHEEGSCGMTEGKMSELDMAGTELIKYAKKNGGIDKKDFFKAAELIQKGDLAKLVKFTNDLDTEPRDLIIMMVADAIGVKQAGKLFKVSIRASKMYETLDKAGLKEELEKDADDPCWKGYVQVGMKKGKDGKEVPNCVPMDEAFELPEDIQDEDVGDFVVAAAAAKKAGKKKFKFGGKEFPVTIKTDIKTEGFEGCKDCELTEELAQPKMNKWLLAWTKKNIEKDFKKGSPEYQWVFGKLFEYSLTDANFHKEAAKVMKMLRRAKAPDNAKELDDMLYDAGAGVANKAGWDGHKIIDAFAFVANMAIGGGIGDKFAPLKEEALNEEKVECPKCEGKGCDHCDGKGYHEKVEEAKSDYEIKHKTFSSAIQHAVEVAAKQGYEVDPDDYDSKVAMGPKKPSKGKTNSYSLKLTKNGKEQKKALQVQIANLDNKFFELNMYIQ